MASAFGKQLMKNFLQLVLSIPAVSVAVLVFMVMRKDGLLHLSGLQDLQRSQLTRDDQRTG
jgi:hypothetical protein